MATVVEGVVYPETDGQPMGENTTQFWCIVALASSLDEMARERGDMFVAGDLFWYPVQGSSDIVLAPDIMVAIGRPRGPRPSYLQWEEGGVAPQVIFEVVSPGNTRTDLGAKRNFCQRYGSQEYYEIDPHRNIVRGWARSGGSFSQVPNMQGYVSPLLRIQFDTSGDVPAIYRPDGRPFQTAQELQEERNRERDRADQAARAAEAERLRAEAERLRADQEAKRAEEERLRADQEAKRAEEERLRAARMADRLRQLGIDPDTLGG